MAERPIQRISPLDLRRNVAVGVPFPLGGTPIFSSTFSTQDQALSNLKCLLLTRKGERPFQPLFGTDLPSFLFEQITEDITIQIENDIVDTFSTWLPFVELREINIDKGDQDLNRLGIDIKFNIRNAPTELESVGVVLE